MDFNVFIGTLIVLNVIVSIKGFEDASFFRKYKFHIGSIRAGEQFRMITSGFLHADIPHLAFNMIALYSFSGIVLHLLGVVSFFTIYLGSLVFGSLLTLYFHKNDYSYSAVGASGAVTGIIFSAILMVPNLRVGLIFLPIGIPGYIFGVLYLLYSIYGMKAKNDNIGHTAHIGGAIGGLLLTLIKNPLLLSENTFFIVVLLIPIIIMVIMAKQGKL